MKLLNLFKRNPGGHPARLVALALAVLSGSLPAHAQNGVWTRTTSGGNWSDTANWSGVTVADGTGNTADFNQVNITTDPNVVHLDSSRSIGNLIFGDTTTSSAAGWLLDNNGAANILTLDATTPTITVNALGSGKAATIGASLAGTVGFTKAGSGELVLTNANTITGGVVVSNGSLTLDFTSGAADILGLGTESITLGSTRGSTLRMIGNAAVSSVQNLAAITLTNAGAVTVAAAPISGVNFPQFGLGAINYDVGSTLDFVGAATSTGVSSATGQTGAIDNGDTTGAVAATATITTTANAGTAGILRSFAVISNSSDVAFATVGLYDFAGISGGVIVGMSQSSGGTAGAGGYTILNTGGALAGAVLDITGASVSLSSANALREHQGVRFNAPVASVVDTSVSGNQYVCGVLVTPNVGANNITFTNITPGNQRAPKVGLRNNASGAMALHQNNTSGILYFANSILDNDLNAGSRGAIVIKTGSGTVRFGVNPGATPQTYRGQTFLNGGVALIAQNLSVGYIQSNAPINLNGGTLVAEATTTLNTSSNARPFNLLAKGGGLGALAGFTLTVPGLVSGVGSDALTIGIPASVNNGNVLGQIPGTGSGTANASQLATGTVVLNNTANNYTGGTVVKSGTLRLGVNNLNALGTGGLTLDGGGFQWDTAVTADISTRPVSINSLGGTLDVNGNTVTLANPIGNSGGGQLTVLNSGVGGSLTLQGANTYTGGTLVNSGTLNVNNVSGSGTGSGNVTAASGATLGGTGTISGNAIWQSGAAASFTQGDSLVVSGTITVNNNPVNVHVPGGTPLGGGSYTLMTYTTAGSSGSFASNPTFTGAGAVPGTYTVSTSGGTVTLTIVPSLNGIWNVDADGNWTDATKWTSNPNVPSVAGDGATFGVGSVLRTVTLNANETVGAIAMTNANSFVIASAGNTLTLDNIGSAPVDIHVLNGTANAIQTAVALSDNVRPNVDSGKALTISGTIANTSTAKTLTASGAGTLTLAGNNTYGPAAGTTGTILNGGGTLAVAHNNALGAGDLSVSANSTLRAGAAGLSLGNNIAIASTATVDNNGNNLTLGGVVSSGGTLAKAGVGTLALAGANTYSGGTVVNAGTLSIASDANLGATPGSPAPNNLRLDGGGLLASTTLALNANRGIGIGPVSGGTGGTGFLDAATGQTLTINGVITSAGNLGANGVTVSGPGTVVLAAANTHNGATTVSGGTLQLANALALQNSIATPAGGSLSFGSLTAATFGGLGGSQNVNLANDTTAPVALTVGAGGGSATYTGTLGGPGDLLKVDSGAATIGLGASGGAAFTGVARVNAGSLTLGGVGSMSTTNNVEITGNQFGAGSANLNIGNAAAITTSGNIVLGGGLASVPFFPIVTSLSLSNTANVSAAGLSFGGTNLFVASVNNNVLPNNCFVSIADNASLTVSGLFDLNNTRLGTAAFSNNRLNLNGGTLSVSNFLATTGQGNHQATIHFNGGLLKATGGDSTTASFLPNPGGNSVILNVDTGGARIDSGAFNITFAPALVDGTAGGTVVKLGTGRLILAGANTYNGLTTVSNGALFINTTHTGAGNFVANDGRTFGVINSNNFASAQINNLTLGHSAGGATLEFKNVADLTVPVLNAAGAVTVNGTCAIKISHSFSVVAGGQYKLLQYGSLGGAGYAGFTLTLPSYITGTLVNNVGSQSVDLLVNTVTYPSITPSLSGSTLNLAWPAEFLGYRLQSQTNDLTVGITGTWFDEPNTGGATSINITVDPASPTVFYRLVYPYP